MSRVRGSRTAGRRKELGRQKHKTRSTCGGLRHAAAGQLRRARPTSPGHLGRRTVGRGRQWTSITSHDASISDRRFREMIHARVGAAASKPALLARDLRGREFEGCEESARGKTGGGRRGVANSRSNPGHRSATAPHTCRSRRASRPCPRSPYRHHLVSRSRVDQQQALWVQREGERIGVDSSTIRAPSLRISLRERARDDGTCASTWRDPVAL